MRGFHGRYCGTENASVCMCVREREGEIEREIG